MQSLQCPVDIIELGHMLAGLCRPVLQQTFRHGLNVKIKANAVPVTQVDLAVETVVRDYLAKIRSEDGVVGEEFAPYRQDAELVWVVDPIIGTNNFIAGNHSFCFLLGCLYKGEPIFGLMDQPITGDRWIGAKGFASTLNDNRICVDSSVPDSAPLRVAVTDRGMKNSKITGALTKFEKKSGFVLRGGDAAIIGLLSAGWIDAVIDDTDTMFPYLPLLPILEGAGGVLINSKGNKANRDSTGILIAGSDAKLRNHILPLF